MRGGRGGGGNRRAGLNKRGQMKGGGTPAGAHFPEVLLAAFAVVPPPAEESVFRTGVVVKRKKRKRDMRTDFSVAGYLSQFESSAPPARKIQASSVKLQKAAANDAKIAEGLKQWLGRDKSDPTLTQNPKNTAFVAGLSYSTTEDELRKYMEGNGNGVKDVKIVRDNEGMSRGYAFVEMESSEDILQMHRSGKRHSLGGRTIIVDFERGRTVQGFKPRRLGGGLGRKRSGRPKRGGSKKRRRTRRRRPTTTTTK